MFICGINMNVGSFKMSVLLLFDRGKSFGEPCRVDPATIQQGFIRVLGLAASSYELVIGLLFSGRVYCFAHMMLAG